jgi:hypothetical protein
MDSVTGVFSSLTEKVKGFFGGKSKASSNPEFEKFLTQIEGSQEALFTAQTNVINHYNENPESVSGTDPKVQEMLNTVSDSSRTNEDLYLQYLKVRADLKEKKVDLKSYEERMAGVQENQKRLEDGFQSIQDFNKDAGLFTPPAATPGEAHASLDTGEFSPDDPQVQGFIDEWLAANGLDSYGRLVGTVKGGVIRANYSADTGGRSRSRYVWEEYWRMQGPVTGQTLGDYVRSRQSGGGAVTTPPATQDPPGTTDPQLPQVADSGKQPEANLYGGSAPASVEIQDNPEATSGNAALSSVTSELNQAVQELQDLQGQQKGSTPEARALLEKIRKLQKDRNGLVNASQ